MIVNMKCPSCGAQMQFDDSMTSMDCPYCGSKVANIAEQVNITQNVNVSGTVVHVQDRSNDPNLFISYNTNNPSVGMVSRIVTTGVKGTYVNGQTLSYHLGQGPHTIILKIGKKNYSRDIVIPPDNQPVRIYASFNGRAQISVDQPNVTAAPVGTTSGGQAVSSSIQAPSSTPKAPGKPKSPLSIVAFILSLTMYLSWAGAGLGVVDIFVLDKEKEKNHTFSFVAIGVGVLLTIGLIMTLVNGGSSGKTGATDAVLPTESSTAIVQISEETTKAVAETTVDATTEETDDNVDEETESNEDANDSGLVDPDLKAFLDSYEAYMDEYIAFLKKMADNPNDLTIMAEYTNMLMKYNEFVEACNKYDPDTMSEVDRMYYLEVTARVEKKLLEASVTM